MYRPFKVAIFIALVIIIILVFVVALFRRPVSQSAALPPPETDHLSQRLSALNLPLLSVEGTALHTHQHLDIFINGQHTVVPAEIGINQSAGFIAPVHTHDTTGFIHVESPTVKTYTLGQFFDIWGIVFTDTCLGNYCNNADKKLKPYLNGQIVNSNYRDSILQPHQEIVVTYGTDFQQPRPIPSAYIFPADY